MCVCVYFEMEIMEINSTELTRKVNTPPGWEEVGPVLGKLWDLRATCRIKIVTRKNCSCAWWHG